MLFVNRISVITIRHITILSFLLLIKVKKWSKIIKAGKHGLNMSSSFDFDDCISYFFVWYGKYFFRLLIGFSKRIQER